MYSLIKRYMNNLNMDTLNDFALKQDVVLSEEELQFTYDFVKKNWELILSNPALLDLKKYQDKYSPENYEKIKKLIQVYYQKYGHLL